MGWTMSWAGRKPRDCCEPLRRRAHKRRPTISKAGKRRGCSPSLSIKPKTVGHADLAHDSFHLRHAAFGPIDIGRPQAGAQHILATDDVQGQIAVMPVVAVEETLFLCPDRK